MRKIYLFCNAGMSTSLLASKMQSVANQHNLAIEIKAFPDSQMPSIIEDEHPDCILLGPQVKFLFEKVVAKYGHLNRPIAVIDSEDYGSMNGERVLKKAIKMIKEKEIERGE